MATLDTVIPNGLNYTDIKPQAVENTIELVKFQPTATVTGARPNDMVKFLLSGNGFLDPYSTFLQFVVEVPDLQANEVRWVDRSAHSFISRIIIRSQGVELERIENYDVIASMINDMIYSPEQSSLHYWEGFPTHTVSPSFTFTREEHDDRIAGNYIVGANNGIHNFGSGNEARDQMTRLLCQGSSPSDFQYVGETSFHSLDLTRDYHEAYNGQVNIYGDQNGMIPQDFIARMDSQLNNELFARAQVPAQTALQLLNLDPLSTLYPVTYAYHHNGKRIPTHGSDVNNVQRNPNAMNIGTTRQAGTTRMLFQIPIYSGVIGLLMPEKKLIPLNLLPLDIEIVFNPHALYSSLDNGSRNYTVRQFNLFAHMVLFEQEIHRTLEASVADHGLFICCNSFHSAPIQNIATDQVPAITHISMNLKSINSVHFIFAYNHFETIPCARKLHFVSHNLRYLQLTNGTTQIPRYAIEGESGESREGKHLPFIIELYKAWNKMHDPTTDGAIHAYNYCGDEYAGQMDPLDLASRTPQQSYTTLMSLCNKQGLVGRCQYGISLEGEELGTDKTMITGRKSQYPFFVELRSTGKTTPRTSYMYTFLRADFIIYVRPDLQVVTLGK